MAKGVRQRGACRYCGARLAADNRTDVCGPCVPRHAESVSKPPRLPATFWDRPEIRKALVERSFGRLLRAYRMAQTPHVRQADLASWLGMTQVQVSRIERGTSRAKDLDKLERWALTLGVPQHCLGVLLSPQSSDAYPSNAGASNLRKTNDAEGDDVRRRQFLKTASAGAVSVGASLLGRRTPTVVPANPSGRSIGSPDVDLVREVTAAFRRVDNRYGGGHSRSAVAAYLKTTVEPMITDGRARTRIRDDLFGAAAELHQLAGWMAYDTGQADLGRRHLRTALRLCQEAEDHALSAEMLAGMSHQAAFHGVPESAVDLALAARQTAKQAGLPMLEAESAVMEAHGLALQGDKRGCLTALREAERIFVSAENTDQPEWLRYFDDAYLAAKFAHSFRDLGQSHEAEEFARRSLEMTEGYERGRLFNTALLASILADLGRIDESCAHGTLAVQMVGTVRSVRSAAYLVDLGRRLGRHSSYPAVRALYQRMNAAGIPTPTSG